MNDAAQALPQRTVLAKLKEEFGALTAKAEETPKDTVTDLNEVIVFIRKVFDASCKRTKDMGLPPTYRRVSTEEMYNRGGYSKIPASTVVNYLRRDDLGSFVEALFAYSVNAMRGDSKLNNGDWRIEGYEVDVVNIPTLESKHGAPHVVFIGSFVDASGNSAPSNAEVADRNNALLADITNAIKAGASGGSTKPADVTGDDSDKVAALEAQIAAMQASMQNFMGQVASAVAADAPVKRKPGRPPKNRPAVKPPAKSSTPED